MVGGGPHPAALVRKEREGLPPRMEASRLERPPVPLAQR